LSEDALSAGGGLESALALFVYFGDVRRYGYGPVSPLAIELATKLRDHRKLGKTARDLLRSRLINA
jgi:hypothetical protein